MESLSAAVEGRTMQFLDAKAVDSEELNQSPEAMAGYARVNRELTQESHKQCGVWAYRHFGNKGQLPGGLGALSELGSGWDNKIP